ncbi:MAG: hypothetical protein ACOYD3_12970 [Kiritimatiellia bacterium]|jgi:hypothetical protein
MKHPQQLLRSLASLVLVGTLARAGTFEFQWPDGGESLGAEFRLGERGPARMELDYEGGRRQTIRLLLGDETCKAPDPAAPEKSINARLTNAVMRFDALRIGYHIRPRARRYTDKQQLERFAAWSAMPDATEVFVRFEARATPDGTLCYIDDLYAGVLDASNTPTTLRLVLPPSGEARALATPPPPYNPRYLPLNFAAVAQPGAALKTATLSLKPGFQQVEGIPMIVADGAHSGDIAKVRQMKGSWALECHEYLSRSAFDNMPESQMMTVPQAGYWRAWVLLAVDPDPARDPYLTVRLTRFAGQSVVGRSQAFADGELILPRGSDKLPPNIRRVGEVNVSTNGAPQAWPLYLAEVELPLGEMLELLAMKGQERAAELKIGPYLDFEFLGRRGRISAQWDGRRIPTGDRSAAHIFGVTLERAPASLYLTQKQPGNVFHGDEVPELGVTVEAHEAGTYRFEWVVTDIDGKQVAQDSLAFELEAGASAERVISLRQPQVGHYKLDIALRTAQQKTIIAHAAAFALLPPDTREAGLDSPYSVWWFGGSHLTVHDLERAGPLHLKAGIRRTVARNFSEAEMAPYKMTLASLGWNFRMSDLDDFEAASTRVYNHTTNMLARYPSCNNALIFHESHANVMPDELAGIEPTFTKAQREDGERKARLANLAGAFYRERFPQIKLIVGNTSGTAKLIADLLRFGFDPRYADYIGIETPGQTFMPEAISEHNLMAAWLAREVARLRGHEMPVTGCYEFTYRADRFIGAHRQAEYYARDILLSHAYGFDHIGPGVLDDAGSSYYNTLWGCSGLLQRSPLLYPKPSYVAVATATRVLDKATCRRIVPTGSLTVYALEFTRDRRTPDLAYGLWTTRGRAGLRFTFDEPTEVELVDLYGRSRRITTGADKTLTVEAGTAAAYVIAGRPAKSITIASRDFSDDDPPATFKPADTMADITKWDLISDYSLMGKYCKRGRFAMRGVDDPERGHCMELELKPDNSLPARVAEYTALRLRHPVPLEGEPHTIGVWVKGNSNWGKLFFEIEDADGRLWRCDGGYNDWPADLAVNFDGWRFLKFFIDESRSPMKNYSPGRQWRSSGGGSKPRYPLHLTGLYVTMYRQAIDPVEMRDVMPVLRFQNIGAFE